MKEKSAAGGSRRAAMAAAKPGGGPGGADDGAAGVVEAAAPAGLGKKLAGSGGVGPKRPPDKLSHPSTLSLKKSVRTSRLDVIPPCECPTNQKAFMFCFPTCSYIRLTMFWR